MKISKEGIEVTKRFFEAIDMLKVQNKIRGLQTFTTLYGINRWNINTAKWHPERSVLKPEWLVYLAREYNVSAEWLLLGEGPMLLESSQITEARLQNEEPAKPERKKRLSRYKDYPYKNT